MRLCSYIITNDTGFAPNPFGGYCTLAACTPNHQGVRLSGGDWVVGHATGGLGRGLIHAMQVAETLDFDTYYKDPRFRHKKPRFDGSWRAACGDNIYYRAANGAWTQHPTLFHDTPENRLQDTRNPRVFVSEHFYYFGENAPEVPKRFSALLRDRQGCKCSHPEELLRAFLEWLHERFEPGIHGDPRDRWWVDAIFDSRRLHPLGRTRRKRSVRP